MALSTEDYSPLAAIMAKYDFIPLARPYFVMIDRREETWVHELKWDLHRRFDGKPVARERKHPRRYLHILVAEKRHGPRPSPEHVCEHVNGDLLDCRADNLRWASKDKTVYRLANPRP